MAESDERITIPEAIRRGYRYGPIGCNHAEGKTIYAPFTVILRLSSGGLYSVKELERLRWELEEPDPAGDIPL